MFEMVTSPSTKILHRWFESEPLISKLATDAVTGAFMGPSTPGSGAVLFHHCMVPSFSSSAINYFLLIINPPLLLLLKGDVGYGRGVWAYVKGGMGAVSQAIAKAALGQGAEVATEAPVKSIIIDHSGSAKGVLLEDGTQINASV